MKRRNVHFLGVTLILIELLVIMAVLVSCATLGQTKPMTAKQQATVWMSVYNSTYDDILSVMKNPASTTAQKDLAQKKKAVLVQAWPLMKIYVAVVESGGVPTLAQTTAITDLINQLAILAGGN